MKPLLLVIDMQNGFLNTHTRHIVPRIQSLLVAFKAAGMPVAFTRFINSPNSGFVRWIGWPRFMTSPEIDLVPGLADPLDPVFDKGGYTAFSDAFTQFVKEKQIDLIAICGVATDSCVLKTAADAFERGIEPVVFSDVCANHKSEEIHRAALAILGRFIGRGQIRDSASVGDILAAGAPPQRQLSA